MSRSELTAGGDRMRFTFLEVVLKGQENESLRAERSNLCRKKRLLRRLSLLAMTVSPHF